MISFIEKKQSNLMYRILCGFISFTFLFSIVVPPGTAQMIGQAQTFALLQLPAPGTMVGANHTGEHGWFL